MTDQNETEHPAETAAEQSPGDDGTQPSTGADVKARMREALTRKNSKEKGVHTDGPMREKAHGSQVLGSGSKMHRRKAGGGGS
jgi:hypothetical protein